MPPTDAQIADRLRAILQADEFQPRMSERIWVWLDKTFGDLVHWLEHLGPGMRFLVIVVCTVALAAIAAHLWQSLREAAAPRRASPARSMAAEQADLSPAVLLARALSLANEGSLRDAARTLQQALLVQACRERNLPWRSSLSDWEWVRVLRPSETIVEFTRTAQRMAFGPQPSRAELDACLQQAQSLIAAREHLGPEAA